MADIIQVALRGTRREFFLNSRKLWLQLRDRSSSRASTAKPIGRVFLKDPTLVELKRPGNVTREIIRKADEEDLDQEDHNRARETEAFEYCRAADRAARAQDGPVRGRGGVRRPPHHVLLLGRAARGLPRAGARTWRRKFQTRIELRQIGVRDQAKRLDGCGPCGRAFCCSTWLKDFHPVTLKMAREQQLSLNPSKISGACGRLMCCLAYELAQYRDSAEKLPPVGAKLTTGQGLVHGDAHRGLPARRCGSATTRAPSTASPTTTCRPGPYHKCGDCGCGKKSKGGTREAGNGGGETGGAGGDLMDGGDELPGNGSDRA